ncbi:MAG: PorP/SprF family type IX secretion system membrane protein [Bacteroidota bacterium]
MHKYFLHITLLFLAATAFAQQPAQYSLNMFNRLAYNPAYAGLDNSLSMTGVFRKQWLNLEGSPTSQHFNIHSPLPFIRSGLGVVFQNDELGVERNMNLSAAYNYQLPVGRTGVLSLGIGGGFIQKNIDGAAIRTPDGEYTDGNLPNHRDPLLASTQVIASAPTIEAGVYYKSEILEAGFAVRDILEEPVASSVFSILPIRSYFLNITAHIDLTDAISFHPTIFAKSDILENQIDFSALFSYNDNISLGASFRGYSANTADAVAIIGGLNLSEKIKLYYSYDLTLSNINTVSTGSHEIMINYNLNKDFGRGVPPPIIYNPRNL